MIIENSFETEMLEIFADWIFFYHLGQSFLKFGFKHFKRKQ